MIRSTKRGRPSAMRTTTTALRASRWASMVIGPVTPGKSRVAASAWRIFPPSAEPARAIAAAIILIAS
jgi:hypothetical protein